MTYTLPVAGIHCGSCAQTVTNALHALDPKSQVEVDVARKQVRVTSEIAEPAIRKALAKAGYPVQATA